MKVTLFIAQNGAPDNWNMVSCRDATSTGLISTYRQNAVANVLNYTEAITKTGNLTAGSNVVAIADTTGLEVDMEVYSTNLKARRSLRIASIVANVSINLKQPTAAATGAYATGFSAYTETTATAVATVVGEVISFGKRDVTANQPQLLKLTETVASGRNPAFHSGMKFFWDAYNVADTVGNANKTKATAIVNVGPLRKKILKNTTTNRLFVQGAPGIDPVYGIDIPSSLTAHDKQQANTSLNIEGAGAKGWGAGMMDYIYPSVLSTKNSALLSVATAGSPVWTVGSNVRTFDINSNAILLRIPNFYGLFSNGAETTATKNALAEIVIRASTTVVANDDFASSTLRPMNLSIEFQSVLVDAMNITDVPTGGMLYNISGGLQTSAIPLADNLKQAARLMHVLAPNRGGLATRAGNTVTINTEVSNGTATRVAGSTTVNVTCANHRLFTSSLNNQESTDSVIVLGTGLDTTPTVNGYEITLDPSDPDNKFTFTSAATTAITDLAVTIRLKHNLNTLSKIFIDGTGFDTNKPIEGYPVISVPSTTQFTLTTTNTGAFASNELSVIYKLIDLPNLVIYVDANYMTWDTHSYANHSQLSALDAACAYYDSLVSRMVNVDCVTMCMGEFGRTIGTNGQGSDHGWGGAVMVFGKSVRSRKLVGTLPNYDINGADITSGFLLPTTSTYQMAATIAKWNGLTDAQVLELFPDLSGWTLAERNLGFLNALV